ncbi:DNA polymerase III epsilon subunit [Candidatus Photodesmus katoptron]|uniref:Exonuclease, RNase T and DNA polymerase III n=1 Tax=Candidatus Photodesmus katoptron Akat1 TaxID=1236703 RepID=S3DHZ6_9GAMM|nr:3'-5' exonuclease [Candidatus Photodesmus katoptron]EPE37295.1 exonuclease, RNase T and DNA polymerase III [Candidatus Photodesmus katoptron Akat1]KEY90034.1 DNA polymerase III epsilon subunit [Candidatus Photodesmus katoptron]
MKKERAIFPLERITEILTRPDDFQLIERISLTKAEQTWPLQLSSPIGDELPIVFLDTETTGLSEKNDTIIELGMVRSLYSPSQGCIVSILDVINLYEEPTNPLSKFVKRLTGITDEMLHGKFIDDQLVASWLDNDPMIVAHNAQFDRPFFEKRFTKLKNFSWACSANEVDWKTLGFESYKLEHLLLRLGWFYDGHRAVNDCLSMVWLFHLLPESLLNLLSKSKQKTIVVRAFGAPFSVKDSLKERGYRWNTRINKIKNHWYREIPEKELIKEKKYLDRLYNLGSKHAHYEYKNSRNRFKD